MDLEEIGVTLGRKGEVLVDDYGQTTVPSVYAVGDVTDRVNLTPVAIREGMAFVEPCSRATRQTGSRVDPDGDLYPPEMGTVGLSEEDAREQEP